MNEYSLRALYLSKMVPGRALELLTPVGLHKEREFVDTHTHHMHHQLVVDGGCHRQL